jgi:transcriptional regulator of arginine metabolism
MTARAIRGVNARRAAIRELISARPIATQENLRALLASRGFAVTQATLSRDLAQLGALRTARPRGGTAYSLGDAAAGYEPVLPELVRGVDDNGTLVVVHTAPGAAQVVAGALDRARPAEILGTIAGDDAVFVAPARGVPAPKLARRVRELLAR